MKKGYTTIELMAVLSLMGILASTALPTIQGFQNEAKTTKAQAEVKTLQGIVERHQLKNHQIPQSLDMLSLTRESNITDQQITDPFTSKPYDLVSGITSDGKSYYIIFSCGPNNQKDFIVDNERVYNQGDDIVATNLLLVSR